LQETQKDEKNKQTSDWFEIKRVLEHRRRAGTMYFKVHWTDGTKSWVKEEDVTMAARDSYWIEREREETKT